MQWGWSMENPETQKWKLGKILWNSIPWPQGLILIGPVWVWTHSGQTNVLEDVFCVRLWGHCVGCGLDSGLLVKFTLFEATESVIKEAAALAEAPSSVPSTCMMAHNSSSRRYYPVSPVSRRYSTGYGGHCTHVTLTLTCKCRHKNKTISLIKRFCFVCDAHTHVRVFARLSGPVEVSRGITLCLLLWSKGSHRIHDFCGWLDTNKPRNPVIFALLRIMVTSFRRNVSLLLRCWEPNPGLFVHSLIHFFFFLLILLPPSGGPNVFCF